MYLFLFCNKVGPNKLTKEMWRSQWQVKIKIRIILVAIYDNPFSVTEQKKPFFELYLSQQFFKKDFIC